MKPPKAWMIGASLLALPALAACDLGGAGERQAEAAAADAAVRSVINTELPDGFTLAMGPGEPRELAITPGPNGGMTASYATQARARSVIAFYEREAAAAGMAPAGTLDAGDVLASNFRRADPRPRKLTVTVSEEGSFSNITLAFDMSQ